MQTMPAPILTPAPNPLEVDDPTAVCLLRTEAARLASSADQSDLALSAALTRGADAILNERITTDA